MTVYAITDTKKGRTGIAPTYLQVGAGAAISNTGNVVMVMVRVSRAINGVTTPTLTLQLSL